MPQGFGLERRPLARPERAVAATGSADAILERDAYFEASDDFHPETFMTETRGRVFDEIGRLMTDAAGAAAGVRREVETAVRAQVSRVLSDLDVVRRDEFEAVRAMAVKAREENERLAEKIAALEAAAGTHRDDAMGEPAPEPDAAIKNPGDPSGR